MHDMHPWIGALLFFLTVAAFYIPVVGFVLCLKRDWEDAVRRRARREHERMKQDMKARGLLMEEKRP